MVIARKAATVGLLLVIGASCAAPKGYTLAIAEARRLMSHAVEASGLGDLPEPSLSVLECDVIKSRYGELELRIPRSMAPSDLLDRIVGIWAADGAEMTIHRFADGTKAEGIANNIEVVVEDWSYSDTIVLRTQTDCYRDAPGTTPVDY